MQIEEALTAIQSDYINHRPNLDIPITTKLIKIKWNTQVVEGEGNVFFAFRSNPGLLVEAEIATGTIELFQGFIDDTVRMFVDDFPDEWLITATAPLTGRIAYVETSAISNLSYIVFHIVNFPKYVGRRVRVSSESLFTADRIILSTDSWMVTIDSTPLTEANIKELKHDGGYAITHIGKLERQDKSAFSSEDGKMFLNELAYFLAFARGFWAPPFFLLGYNTTDKNIWSEWGIARHIYPWKYVNSWFDGHHAWEMLPSVFQGYTNLIRNPLWNEVLQKAIYWYISSNTMMFAEGALILCQSALELLAWNFLVKDKKNLSQEAFVKISAADQIRLLISHCDINLSVPPSLTNLARLAKSRNNSDGPGIFTFIRNTLVHPGKKYRQSGVASGEDIYESLCMGLWYVELVILWLCNYDGNYASRVLGKSRWTGEVEPVPWSIQ